MLIFTENKFLLINMAATYMPVTLNMPNWCFNLTQKFEKEPILKNN